MHLVPLGVVEVGAQVCAAEECACGCGLAWLGLG